MEKHSESTIAALLRHSTTTLVRRYAHLSQDHLRGAVEHLAQFGKPAQNPDIQTGTVTRTGNEEKPESGRDAEVVGNVGAGDGI